MIHARFFVLIPVPKRYTVNIHQNFVNMEDPFPEFILSPDFGSVLHFVGENIALPFKNFNLRILSRTNFLPLFTLLAQLFPLLSQFLRLHPRSHHQPDKRKRTTNS